MENIVERLLSGDRRALARMVKQIENEIPPALRFLAELHQHTGHAHIVGVIGTPGACIIIAVDSTSPFTGGAILGDRIRMMELSGDPMVCIRSMASRGNLGGLAASTRDVVRAMDAAGYNPIIIEKVGTGQAEVEVMRTAQTVTVVAAPGMGDGIHATRPVFWRSPIFSWSVKRTNPARTRPWQNWQCS